MLVPAQLVSFAFVLPTAVYPRKAQTAQVSITIAEQVISRVDVANCDVSSDLREHLKPQEHRARGLRSIWWSLIPYSSVKQKNTHEPGQIFAKFVPAEQRILARMIQVDSQR